MPACPAGSLQQQVMQQYSYLFQMAQQLNLALEQLEQTGGGVRPGNASAAGAAGGVIGHRAGQGHGQRVFAFVIGKRRVLRPMLLRVAFDGRGRLCAAGGEQQKHGQKQNDRNSFFHAKVLLRLFYRRRTKK